MLVVAWTAGTEAAYAALSEVASSATIAAHDTASEVGVLVTMLTICLQSPVSLTAITSELLERTSSSRSESTAMCVQVDPTGVCNAVSKSSATACGDGPSTTAILPDLTMKAAL